MPLLAASSAHLDAAIRLQNRHRLLKLLLLLWGHAALAATLHILDGLEHCLLRTLQLQGNEEACMGGKRT